MSRIGNQPIHIPANVTVVFGEKNEIRVSGPKGSLVQAIQPSIKVNIKDNRISVGRADDQKTTKAYHGLYRVLINNMVTGVAQGFKKSLEMVGIGYKANVQDNLLELQVGKSHTTYLVMPPTITAEVVLTKGKKPQTFIHVKGVDKQLVGHVAAKIREQKPPEAYISKRGNTQKGIRYVGETLIGKSKKDAK